MRQQGHRRAAGHHFNLRQRTGRDWPYSAVKLVDDLAGASPASASFPVGTVVISDDGAGDQAVGSSEVNVLVGWMRIRSAPTKEGKQSDRDSVGINRRGAVMEEIIQVRNSEPTWPRAMRGRS